MALRHRAPTHPCRCYILRRNVEGGGRQQSFDNSTFRIVAGVRGAINEAWGYDVSAQYSQGTGTTVDAQLLPDRPRGQGAQRRRRRRRPALPVVSRRHDPNCVPWNPFVVGGITQDQLAYLQVTGVQVGRITQEIYNGIDQR